MTTKFSKKLYNSKAWKQVRESYIFSKYGICERCGRPNAKQLHHKILLTPENINDPEITLDTMNLELLCNICHQLEHNRKYSAIEEGLMFDNSGMIIQSPPSLKVN